MRKVTILLTFIGLLLMSSLSYGGSGKEEAESPYGNWSGVTINVAILGGMQPITYTEAADGFEKITGGKVVINDFPFASLYDKFMTESVSHSGAFDVMSPAQFWVGDFVAGGFIQPLDKYMKKWPLEDPNDMIPTYRRMGEWGGKTYTIVTDGDHFALYYRKSLFEDPIEKAAFKKKYGYELGPPDTWEQFHQIAEFFIRDTDGDGRNDMWGTALMAARTFMGFEFAQRFYSYGGEWFDPNTMEPRVNSEAGVKAFKAIYEVVKLAPPGVLNWGFTETRDAFVQGKLAMLVQWADIGGQSEKPEMSKVVGDVRYALVPGAMVNDELNRKSLLAWGFSTMLSADSKNPEAAYQFMRYFSSKEVSTWVVSRFLGLEPWRYSHFKSPTLLNAFPSAPEFYENMMKSMEIGVPDLRIPGAQKYYDIIAIRLGDALAKGEDIDYQAVMDQAAKEWDVYTNQLGREKQLEIYRESIGYTK